MRQITKKPRLIKASIEQEYEVTVNFGGYIGADEIYTVYASDDEKKL